MMMAGFACSFVVAVISSWLYPDPYVHGSSPRYWYVSRAGLYDVEFVEYKNLFRSTVCFNEISFVLSQRDEPALPRPTHVPTGRISTWSRILSEGWNNRYVGATYWGALYPSRHRIELDRFHQRKSFWSRRDQLHDRMALLGDPYAMEHYLEFGFGFPFRMLASREFQANQFNNGMNVSPLPSLAQPATFRPILAPTRILFDRWFLNSMVYAMILAGVRYVFRRIALLRN